MGTLAVVWARRLALATVSLSRPCPSTPAVRTITQWALPQLGTGPATRELLCPPGRVRPHVPGFAHASCALHACCALLSLSILLARSPLPPSLSTVIKNNIDSQTEQCSRCKHARLAREIGVEGGRGEGREEGRPAQPKPNRQESGTI